MSLNCPDISTTCSSVFGPQYNGDVKHTFQCPVGTYITKVSEAQRNSNLELGSFLDVTCSNGSILSECAGVCPPSKPVILGDCSSSNAVSVAGFTGRSGARYDFLTPECEDGTHPISPAGWSIGGTDFRVVCPISTHKLGAVEASTGCTSGDECVTSMKIVCRPLSQICSGETLNEPFCFQYCGNNRGVCDASLKAFCSIPANFDKPLCGCALPDSAYPILSLRTPENTVPPIACDKRCQSNSAIKLANTGTCTISTLCVQSNIDLSVIQSTVSGSIQLNQNCGSSSAPASSAGGITKFLTSTLGIALIVGLIVLIIAIIIIAVVVSNRNKRRKEEERRKQLEQQRAIERQTTTKTVRHPTVVRLQ